MNKEIEQTTDPCLCMDAETHFGGFEKKVIGVDDDYGEVSLWTCTKCRRIWLHYFVEYEYLTAAGRMFTGLISPDTAATMKSKDAVNLFEKMDWYFRGGSAFGSKLLRTKGPLKPWLIPFPGK
jgi:hypothetical protein